MKVTAGAIFLEMILIFSFIPLKAEVDALAVAEGAGNFEALLATVFPYLWIFLIIIFSGIIVWEMVLKK